MSNSMRLTEHQPDPHFAGGLIGRLLIRPGVTVFHPGLLIATLLANSFAMAATALLIAAITSPTSRGDQRIASCNSPLAGIVMSFFAASPY